MSKVKIIPELRFPEFEKDGEWVEEPLSSKVSVIDGDRGLNYPKAEEYSSDGYCLFLSAKNVTKSGFVFNEFQFITKEKDELLRKGKLSRFDIVLTTRGSLGQFAFFDENIQFENIRINSGMVILRAKDNRINPNYLYSYFNSNSIQSAIKSQGFGNAVQQLTVAVINNFTLRYPYAPKEQQKIASCLSSLDEIIATYSQKLNLLKDHKKGMMQNLFPQEGEKVPKYRFKEFEKNGEWVEKKLGDLIELKGRIGYRGYTLEDIVGKGEGAISMSPSNINEFGTLSFTKSTYITWAKYEESPEIMLENGFTVLVKTGSTYGKVAFIKNLTKKTTINPQLVVLKPKRVNNYFLYLLVANKSIQKQINATVVGGAIPTLSQESISNFDILVPQIKEQEKIAECLSTLNDLIISQTERIEQLKLHKKGLMQVLFPKINE
jgi:type I restriction enzyme S subunit